jgi:dsRNA-specific ribonuclease
MDEIDIDLIKTEDDLIKTEDELMKNDYDLVKTDKGLIFDPYNSINKSITEDEVKTILVKYGLPPIVRNLEIYERAFVHCSYVKRPQYENDKLNITIVDRPADCMPLKTKSNDRLEFIGDGILECITKLYLYKRFPKENEGFMTEKKIEIVKNESVGKMAYEMGLHKWLFLSKHAEEKKIRTSYKNLGCLFEAFIGAVFLNFETHNPESEDTAEGESPGFKMVKILLNKIFETHIDWANLIQNNDNYKNILQVKIQKEFKVTPHYMEIDHDEEFGYKMGVYLCLGQNIHNVSHQNSLDISLFKNFKSIHEYLEEKSKVLIYLGEGQHKIKRKAEQMACDRAIKIINNFTF